MTAPLMRRVARIALALVLLSGISAAAEADNSPGQAFKRIRIGDPDGFGFTSTKGLMRPLRGLEPGPADTDGDGMLERNEFLPDLDGDGGVWWRSDDNFDHRSEDEIADKGHRCVGCSAIGAKTRGSIWTDLALSRSSIAKHWPDADGPETPNNATFVFDFTVASGRIASGAQIFFNMVFADYDVDPALISVKFAKAPPRVLSVSHQGDLDGLIQARSAILRFGEVFTRGPDGDWRGFVEVVFDAPYEPYTAFDYVELSLFDVVVSAPGRGVDPG